MSGSSPPQHAPSSPPSKPKQPFLQRVLPADVYRGLTVYNLKALVRSLLVLLGCMILFLDTRSLAVMGQAAFFA